MITLPSPQNAPDTTIAVNFLCLSYTIHDNGRVNLGVTALDSNQKPVTMPRPRRVMTQGEQAAFLACTANVGETIQQLLERAAKPYVTAAYGFTY